MRAWAISRIRSRSAVLGSWVLWYRKVETGMRATRQARRWLTRYTPRRYLTPGRRREGFLIFCQHILQHRLVQAQVGNQSPRSRVLFLKLLQLPHLVDLQTHVLLLPTE